MKINLKLQILTPAFIGGARARHPDKEMPFRPPSVRGALRWWFRAGLAGVLWPQSVSLDSLNAKDREDALKREEKRCIEELRRLETMVFGSTDRASPLAVGVPRGAVIRHIDQPSRHSQAGLLYLGYGVFDGGVDAVETEPGGYVDLPLFLNHRAPDGVAPVLAATLWLWTHLGGIGARSRRGWGSLGAVELSGDDLNWPGPKFGQIAADVPAAHQQLSTGISSALTVFDRFLQRHSPEWVGQGNAPLTLMRTLDDIASIDGLSRTHPGAMEALNAAGGWFVDYRSTVRRNAAGLPPLADYFAVKQAISAHRGGPVSPIGRAAFGLPLPFYFRSLNGEKATVYPSPPARWGKELGTLDRLASPLFLRVIRVGNGPKPKYTTAFIDFSGADGNRAFSGMELVLEHRKKDHKVSKTESTWIRAFIQWAKAAEKHQPGGR